MSEIVNCPDCQRQLRVPEELLGKKVKCPSCNATFTATAATPEPPPPAEEDKETYDTAPVAEDELDPTPRPRRRRRVADDDDDDDFDDEPGSRRGRRRGGPYRGDAMAAVSGPATACLISGILMILISACSLVVNVTGAGAGAIGGRNADIAVAHMFSGALGAVQNVIVIVTSVIVILGAQKMKNLQSYGLALTSAILTVIPCTTCLCWGLPIGIWAIVVLARPDVKDAFS